MSAQAQLGDLGTDCSLCGTVTHEVQAKPRVLIDHLPGGSQERGMILDFVEARDTDPSHLFPCGDRLESGPEPRQVDAVPQDLNLGALDALDFHRNRGGICRNGYDHVRKPAGYAVPQHCNSILGEVPSVFRVHEHGHAVEDARCGSDLVWSRVVSVEHIRSHLLENPPKSLNPLPAPSRLEGSHIYAK